MDLPQNKLKRALRAGQVQIGCWLNLPTHVTVEVMTKAGFDWLLIDTEHSPNDIPQVHQQLQAATGGDSSMVVRVPWNDMVTIKRYLDVGAQSLLIPCVQSEQEAHDAVSYTRYPPKGIRGYASMPRAAHFGLVKDYPKICEDDLFVALQIETQQGMDNIEKIAKIDGVDALFVGPGDLAASLGHVGNPQHPDVQKAIESSIKRILDAGRICGILAPQEQYARRYLELGCKFVAVGSDMGVLLRGAEQLAAKYKSPKK
jgi:4-hydroxy-2-oxoheptanedioate aldolase